MFFEKVYRNYTGFPKEAKYLVYASIMPAVAYGMLFTDLSYFLTTVRGVSTDFMGVVLTSMGISTFIASIFLGIVADIYGRKKLLIMGNVLASIILVVFALTEDPLIMLLAGILEGISEAAILASSSALLADKTMNEKRTSAFSLYGFTQSIAFGLGGFAIPAVAIFELAGFTEEEGHVLLFSLIAAISLLSTLIMFKVSESKMLKKTRNSLADFLPKKSKDVLIKYTIASAILAFGAGMIIPLMTKWFELQYGISDKIRHCFNAGNLNHFYVHYAPFT
jgi:MFS family permease